MELNGCELPAGALLVPCSGFPADDRGGSGKTGCFAAQARYAIEIGVGRDREF